jgi:general L-amino acid transport system permease protein
VTTVEAARPPEPPGPLAWIQKNLFSTWYNSLLTLVSLAVIIWAAVSFLRWAFTTANWEPVTRYLMLYLVGQYPRSDLWRLGLGLAMISLLFGISWRLWGGAMRMFTWVHAILLLGVALWPAAAEAVTTDIRIFLFANLGLIVIGFILGGARFLNGRVVLIAWLIALALTLVLLHGLPGAGWLPVIPTTVWGGLMVTLILAVGGIVLSFPIGVLLALGRRSTLPVVSLSSAVFIEVIRGLPLVGVLFLASLLVPLFLPTEVRVDRLLRALVGITIFTAAYMAENVRGGLAAVPSGQEEAARALGLTASKRPS